MVGNSNLKLKPENEGNGLNRRQGRDSHLTPGNNHDLLQMATVIFLQALRARRSQQSYISK